MVNSPKWKTLAAKTALALPSYHAFSKVFQLANAAACNHRNINNISDSLVQFVIESTFRVPSLSIDVTSSSPAP
jgi:hypothetical protein